MTKRPAVSVTRFSEMSFDVEGDGSSGNGAETALTLRFGNCMRLLGASDQGVSFSIYGSLEREQLAAFFEAVAKHCRETFGDYRDTDTHEE